MIQAPEFKVITTNNRGLTPEELAEQCADKLVYISDDAAPEIRDQAHEFRRKLVSVMTTFMKRSVRNDRTTVYNAIIEAGHPKLAELIRRL